MNYGPSKHNQAREVWQRFRDWGLDPPMNWAERVRDIVYATNMTIADFCLLAPVSIHIFDRLAGISTSSRYIPSSKTITNVLRLERMFDAEIQKYRSDPRLYNRVLRPGGFAPFRSLSREEMGLLG